MPDRSIDKAVILAAGRGTRMGEITQELPKPMLPIHGKPMLEHILDHLQTAGVSQVFIVVGYRHDVIEQHFGGRPGVTLKLQDPVNGTGSAALLAADFAGPDPFLLTYADIMCDPAEYLRCGGILLAHSESLAVLGVKAVDDPWQGAAVYEQDGRVSRIIEKPPKGTSTTRWNSAGFYAFRPALFDYLKRIGPSPRGEYELTSAIDLMLHEDRDVRISPVEGRWRDVGRPDDLAAENAG